MDEYDCYVGIMKSILKYSKNEKYDTLIPIFLNKLFQEYYYNRNSKKYNLDNFYKKYLPILYIALNQKYVMTNKDDLIFKNKYMKKILVHIYEWI